MDKRLLKKVAAFVITIAIGAAGTYAAFNSNIVTLSGSSMSAGDAHLKLCNTNGTNDWQTTIPASLTASGLMPESTSGLGKEFTANNLVLVGNDNGGLTTSSFSGCTTYGQAATTSSISLKMTPTLSAYTCSATELENLMEVKFEFFDSTGTTKGASTWKSLKTWTTNSLEYGPTFNPNDVYRVKVYGRLRSGDNDEQLKNASCTFNAHLTGTQTAFTPPTP